MIALSLPFRIVPVEFLIAQTIPQGEGEFGFWSLLPASPVIEEHFEFKNCVWESGGKQTHLPVGISLMCQLARAAHFRISAVSEMDCHHTGRARTRLQLLTAWPVIMCDRDGLFFQPVSLVVGAVCDCTERGLRKVTQKQCFPLPNPLAFGCVTPPYVLRNFGTTDPLPCIIVPGKRRKVPAMTSLRSVMKMTLGRDAGFSRLQTDKRTTLSLGS